MTRLFICWQLFSYSRSKNEVTLDLFKPTAWDVLREINSDVNKKINRKSNENNSFDILSKYKRIDYDTEDIYLNTLISNYSCSRRCGSALAKFPRDEAEAPIQTILKKLLPPPPPNFRIKKKYFRPEFANYKFRVAIKLSIDTI